MCVARYSVSAACRETHTGTPLMPPTAWPDQILRPARQRHAGTQPASLPRPRRRRAPPVGSAPRGPLPAARCPERLSVRFSRAPQGSRRAGKAGDSQPAWRGATAPGPGPSGDRVRTHARTKPAARRHRVGLVTRRCRRPVSWARPGFLGTGKVHPYRSRWTAGLPNAARTVDRPARFRAARGRGPVAVPVRGG